MAVMLKQIDEIYEVDSEKEATELIEKAKEEFDVTKSSVTYKYKKTEDREYYLVTIRKSFTPVKEEE
jgi:hypothetical protein